MTNINQTVWRILEKDLAVQKDISRGIINTRALAKHLTDAHSLNVSIDAVVSAIRRFKTEEIFEEQDKKFRSLFKHSSIQTRNSMAIIEAHLDHIEFLKRFCESYRGFSDVRLITGTEELKLVCNARKVERFKKMFKPREISKVIDNVSEISIILNKEAVHTKGVLARIVTEVSLQNINIEEMIVCSPEIILYVKEKSTAKAHEILLGFS